MIAGPYVFLVYFYAWIGGFNVVWGPSVVSMCLLRRRSGVDCNGAAVVRGHGITGNTAGREK